MHTTPTHGSGWGQVSDSCTTRLKIAHSSWDTSSVYFSILKGACGSCATQLPFSSVRSQKSTLEKKSGYVKNSKRFFINTIMTKWKRLGARVCDPQCQPKVNCTPIYCVYVCCQGVGDSNKTFNLLFQTWNQSSALVVPQEQNFHAAGAVTFFGHARYRPLSTPDLSWTLPVLTKCWNRDILKKSKSRWSEGD